LFDQRQSCRRIQLARQHHAEGQDQLLLRTRRANRRAGRLGQPDVGDDAMRMMRTTRGMRAMRLAPGLLLALLLATVLQAQTPSLRPLHISVGGVILDDAGKPVLLRGLNRSLTGYGNADANATDQEYAAQNQLLSMNLVRIFVNAAWWNNNVQVPIANQTYQN